MKHMHLIQKIVFILLLIGGLNWGFIGLFGWNVVGSIFGEMSAVSRIIYTLVGIAAVYRIIQWARSCSR